MASRAGYVLVGGQSTRFGANKALVDVGGRPLAVHVAAIVREAAGEATLVGDPALYASLGLPVIADQVERFGPVAGLAAALEHTSAEWNLVVACDMPRLRTGFLKHLLRAAETAGASALVPIQPDGRAQPLCAVYSAALREPMKEAVRTGLSRVTEALRAVDVRYMLPPEYAHIDPSGEVFLNVNTQADFRRALRA